MVVNTKGPPDANIMIVGDAPDRISNETGVPFRGSTGKLLNKLLHAAGISRHDCLLTNVAREYPPGDKVAFFFEDNKCTIPKPILSTWIEQLKAELKVYKTNGKPNIIVALGNIALWALTGKTGITENRGYILNCSLVPGIKVLPTWHPSYLFQKHNLNFDMVMDLKKALRNSYSSKMPADDKRLYINDSVNEFKSYLDFLTYEHIGPVSLDIETCQPGTHIDIFGVGHSEKEAHSFEFIKGRHPKYSYETELKIWLKIAKLCDKKQLIMANGKYDMTVLMHHFGIFVRHFYFDTMVAGHVCWPEAPRSLRYLASICLNVQSWKATSLENPLMYNAEDVANTFGIYKKLNKELDKQNKRILFEFELDQSYPASMMEIQGIPINTEVRDSLLKETNDRIENLLFDISKKLDRKISIGPKKDSINLNSWQQLSQLLYIDMKLPPKYKRRKSRFDKQQTTTDKEALKSLLIKTKNPVLEKIIEVKKLVKRKQFIAITPSPKGTVHTCYNITGATMANSGKAGKIYDSEESYKSFGRWSSSKSIIFPFGTTSGKGGNLQQITKSVRGMYEPPEGFEIIEGDGIQAEAVVVAYLSNDTKLIDMHAKSYGLMPSEREKLGYDTHKLTAAEMFNINIDNITKEQRRIGKTIKHATNYDAGPNVLSSMLGISLPEAKALLKLYFNKNPQLTLWHNSIEKELRLTRTLVNLFGRSHLFLGKWDDNLLRSGYSYKPQSTIGDWLNKSLLKLYNTYGDVITICMQLHDAIYVFSKIGERKQTVRMMRECMKHKLIANGLEFYIDVDFKAGKNWKDMKTIEVPHENNI